MINLRIGDWELGNGDWGLGIGDWGLGENLGVSSPPASPAFSGTLYDFLSSILRIGDWGLGTKFTPWLPFA
ncbi:hypothetical protein EH233_03110 [Anabaena sp. YBS01]|nr:hypothetical protein EH233_03110 [Anabaena sp. YBS01]